MNAHESQVDVFVYRLLGSIGCGLGVILTAYSTYLTFDSIPSINSVLMDFDIDLPATTLFILRVPWLPLAFSLPGVCLGAGAIFTVRRAVLASCWLFVLLSLGLVLLCQYALEIPMLRLIDSVSSGI